MVPAIGPAGTLIFPRMLGAVTSATSSTGAALTVSHDLAGRISQVGASDGRTGDGVMGDALVDGVTADASKDGGVDGMVTPDGMAALPPQSGLKRYTGRTSKVENFRGNGFIHLRLLRETLLNQQRGGFFNQLI